MGLKVTHGVALGLWEGLGLVGRWVGLELTLRDMLEEAIWISDCTRSEGPSSST